MNGHYGVASFIIGNTLSSSPYLLLISIVPGAMAYYLIGLQNDISHFAYFALMLFASMILVESLMMLIASAVPNYLLGIITGAGIQGIMILNGGFFRLPNDLPRPVWKYPGYYISFHKYANEGFYKNEFQGLVFPNLQVGGPSKITGDEILRTYWQMDTSFSKWIDIAIVFGMVIGYRFLSFGIVKGIEMLTPIIRKCSDCSAKNRTDFEDD